jgi:hypothetical protein
LNVYLNILSIDAATDRITLHEKNILAMDAVMEVYSKAEQSIVNIKASNFIIKILKAQIAYLDSNSNAARSLAYEQYFMLCKENLEKSYEEDYQDLPKLERCVTNNLCLLIRAIEEMDGCKAISEETKKTETVELTVFNHTSIVPPNKFNIKADLKCTVWELKNQICDIVGPLNSKAVFLMTRGSILFRNDKLLKDVGISTSQKIMIFDKGSPDEADVERNCESQMYDNINNILAIVPDANEELIEFVMERVNNSLEETIIALTDPFDRPDWNRKFKEFCIEQEKKKRRDNEEALMQTRQNSLGYMISCCGEFYELVFKFLEFNNDNLETKIWQFLKVIPANQKVILNIKHAILGIDCTKDTKYFTEQRELTSKTGPANPHTIKEDSGQKNDPKGNTFFDDPHNRTFNSMQDLNVVDSEKNKNLEVSSNPGDFLSLNSANLPNEDGDGADMRKASGSFANDNFFDSNFGDDEGKYDADLVEVIFDTQRDLANAYNYIFNDTEKIVNEFAYRGSENQRICLEDDDQRPFFDADVLENEFGGLHEIVDAKRDFPPMNVSNIDSENIIRVRKKVFHPANDLLKNFTWKQMIENSSRNIILYEIEVLKNL